MKPLAILACLCAAPFLLAAEEPLPTNREVTIESPSQPQYLYEILSVEDWQASQKKASTQRSAEDTLFIHLATEDQLERIIGKYWADAPQFIILKIETAKMEGKLVLEANPGGTTKYYHLYDGSIPLNSIVESNVVEREARNI